MTHFDTASFSKALQGDKLLIVDFWAVWCGPCRMLGPVVEKLEQDYAGRAVVGKVNVDEQPQLAAQFGVMSIPTVIFFKNGKEIDRKVGVMPEEVFVQTIEKNL